MKKIRRFIRFYRIFLIYLSVILLSMTALGYGVVPGVKKMISLFAAVNMTTKELATLREKSMKLTSLSETDLADSSLMLVQAVPMSLLPSTIFMTIDGLTQKYGVQLTNIALDSLGSVSTESASVKPKGVDAKTGANSLSFTITVAGSIENIRNFIDGIIRVRRLIRLDIFDIAFIDKEDSSGFTGVKSTMRLSTFWSGMAKTTPKVADPVPELSDADQLLLEKVKGFTWMGQMQGDSRSPSSGVAPSLPDGPIKNDPFAL